MHCDTPTSVEVNWYSQKSRIQFQLLNEGLRYAEPHEMTVHLRNAQKKFNSYNSRNG